MGPPSRRGLAALLVVMLTVAGGLAGCTGGGGTGVVVANPTQAGSTAVKYGPFTVPAARGETMGMIKNSFAFNVKRPCSNCYITGMQASLETADGQPANVDKGLWLHHMVLFDSAKQDVTCPGIGVGAIGQRFFSSGNERTPTKAGGPYGYPQAANSNWTLIYDLMNMTQTPQSVRIVVNFDYVPLNTPGMRPITPVWLDVNQCSTSERPAQEGKFSYTYSVVAQQPSKLIGIGGHIHDGGVNLVVTQNGQQICDSRAAYGETPQYVEGPTSAMPGMPHISSMSRCQGTREAPVATIKTGDRIGISANYDMTGQHGHGGPAGQHPVMGIAIGYMDMGAGA